jgi:hypothetical protein
MPDGVLLPGPSRNARPRVAGPPQQEAERDIAAAARALSRGLAVRRRARGLTQPELALEVGVSVTMIGHAETGRLWQSRHFWEHADAVLEAGGDLLRLHEAFGEAIAAGSPPDLGAPGAADSADSAGAADPAGAAGADPAAGPAHEDDGPPGAREPAVPACVMIMWGDGRVTTIHPPEGAAGAPPCG